MNQQNDRRVVPLTGGRQYLLLSESGIVTPGCNNTTLFWSLSECEKVLGSERIEYLVGGYQNIQCWVCELSVEQANSIIASGGALVSLRSLLASDEQLFSLAGRAVQLVGSYRDHKYCGHCGLATQPVKGEHALNCELCQRVFYPRLSPCAIMLVTKGEYCLLARHRGREDLFSCLAGYVEPGESVEQTVSRETLEEVSVAVGGIHYFGSQPWPFPGQLMLGFHADYASGEIQPDGIEIIEADWFRYNSLPLHPGPKTLSGQLIGHFVECCETG